MAKPPRRPPGMPQPGTPLLTNQPYIFGSTNGQYGTLTVNAGAAFAGQSYVVNQSDINNSISKPFVVTRLKVSVTRLAGGNEVDSDYDEVLLALSGSAQDMKYLKNPTALSAVLDRQRREWLMQPGKLMFGWQNGGADVAFSIRPGARGAPFNISLAFHGHLQTMQDVSAADLPPDAPGIGA